MTEYYTIGQMAEINHTTKKALMIYHDMGLLVPAKIDPETNYRFYTLSQCSTLDMILQLQQVGLSLSEIKSIVDSQDIHHMEQMLHRQIDRLNQQIRQLQFSIETANEWLDTCRLMSSPVEYGKITLEYLPRRAIWRYDATPYPVQSKRTEDPQLSNWEMSLRSIKTQMIADRLPLVLFHNIGCIIKKESLEHEPFICPGGYVFCPTGVEGNSCWEEGWCLTTTIDRMFDEAGSHLESLHLHRLIEAAKANGYAIRGDYYCETLAETPAFFYVGRDMMLRLRLPVQVDDPDSFAIPFQTEKG